jgi:hypothetical protein
MKLTGHLGNLTNQQAQLFTDAPLSANRFTVSVEGIDVAGVVVSAIRLWFSRASGIFSPDAVKAITLLSPNWSDSASESGSLSFVPVTPQAFPVSVTLQGEPDGQAGASGSIYIELTTKDPFDVNATADVALVKWRQQPGLLDQIGLSFRAGQDRLLLTQNPTYPLPSPQTLLLVAENKYADTPILMPAKDSGRRPRLELSFSYGDGLHHIGTSTDARAIKIAPVENGSSGKCQWQGGPAFLSPPDPSVPNQPDPVWVMAPEAGNATLLGVAADGDDTVAFAVTVPEALPGNADDVTSLFINWYDIPGYDDGRTALDIPLNLPAPTIILRGPASVEDGESCALSWETMAITKLVLSINTAETQDLPALPAVTVTLDKPELMNCTSYLAALPPPPYLTVTYTLTGYDLEQNEVTDCLPSLKVTIDRKPAQIESFAISPVWRLPPPGVLTVSWDVKDAVSVMFNNGAPLAAASGAISVQPTDAGDVTICVLGRDDVRITRDLQTVDLAGRAFSTTSLYEPDYVYGRPQQNYTMSIVFLEDGLTCVFSYVPPDNPMTPEFTPGDLSRVTLTDCLEAPDRLNIPMSVLMQLYSNGVWQNGPIAGFGQLRLTKDASGKDIWVDNGQKGTPDLGYPQKGTSEPEFWFISAYHFVCDRVQTYAEWPVPAFGRLAGKRFRFNFSHAHDYGHLPQTVDANGVSEIVFASDGVNCTVSAAVYVTTGAGPQSREDNIGFRLVKPFGLEIPMDIVRKWYDIFYCQASGQLYLDGAHDPHGVMCLAPVSNGFQITSFKNTGSIYVYPGVAFPFTVGSVYALEPG